jgi:hypothetical protein
MKDSKQLIIQFKIDGHDAPENLDALINIEEELIAACQKTGVGQVDGHDIGSGEMNIFIIVSDWTQGVSFLKNYMKTALWAKKAVAAKRQLDGKYEVIWPENRSGSFKIT